jgi:hypothetical protein
VPTRRRESGFADGISDIIQGVVAGEPSGWDQGGRARHKSSEHRLFRILKCENSVFEKRQTKPRAAGGNFTIKELGVNVGRKRFNAVANPWTPDHVLPFLGSAWVLPWALGNNGNPCPRVGPSGMGAEAPT